MVIHIAKKASTPSGGSQNQESSPVERRIDLLQKRLCCTFKISNYNFDEFVKSQNFDFFHCNPLKLKDLKSYFCAFCAFFRPYQSSMTKIMESTFILNVNPLTLDA
jgi:hypothetical protein